MKDQLFNPQSVGDLAAEFAAGVPGFDADRFTQEALGGFATRELMQRMEWLADCLENQLSPDFAVMADQLEAAMPPLLDPALCDDDFGRFIHAIPGILAVRHGLEHHRERALDLIYEATKRFSMEFSLRHFLIRWPGETLVRVRIWGRDENYHVRRLASEGTRPRLPWGKAVGLSTGQTVPLLDMLYSDDTRFVTRSVANHLNDIAKFEPDLVVGRLRHWAAQGNQAPQELAWMTRHALRSLIKQGHPGALALMGYRQDVAVAARVTVKTPQLRRGEALEFSVALEADEALPVLVDYRLRFARAGGKTAQKVFKLKQGEIQPGKVLELGKIHKLKADATTFRLYPGAHGIVIQVNGCDVAEAGFELT